MKLKKLYYYAIMQLYLYLAINVPDKTEIKLVK